MPVSDHMRIEQLQQIASKFRSAIEMVPESSRPVSFESFPNGSCGDSSLLLGAHFVDLEIAGFEYISGERGCQSEGTWTSHSWLERNGCVIDITADQFSDAPSPVIVADPSPWHYQFERNGAKPSDFRMWTGIGVDFLKPMCSAIKKILEEQSGGMPTQILNEDRLSCQRSKSRW